MSTIEKVKRWNQRLVEWIPWYIWAIASLVTLLSAAPNFLVPPDSGIFWFGPIEDTLINVATASVLAYAAYERWSELGLSSERISGENNDG